MPQHYPFSAVVGSDDMSLALILTVISPEIGGVLVRGEKGTAKSTIVRALAAVQPPIDVYDGDRFSIDPASTSAESPDGPFDTAQVLSRPVRLVELPVGATEDRVLGSLHLEKALSSGVAEFEPGLLAKAHRGILYVDEVNLLHDHLVDLLLDAAAMGRSRVERDGISVEHAARFVLIGTMNPEEGELRPQLLDRFGLTVEVAAPRDPVLRADVVRRRMAFDHDPASFIQQYAAAEADLMGRIVAARDLVRDVEVTDVSLMRIAEICAAFDVDGMRADIVTARAAAAHAAWQGRKQVEKEDIAVAVRFSLPHRRRRNPFDAPGLDEDELEEILENLSDENDENDEGPDDDGPDDGGPGDDPGPDSGPPPDSDAGGEDSSPETSDGPESAPAPAPSPEEEQKPSTQQTHETSDTAQRAKLFAARGLGHGDAGRRSRALTNSGRRVASERADGSGEPLGRIDLPGTIRAAAERHTPGGRMHIATDDLRFAVTEGKESNLVLLCVDASGSMAARRRMRHVKTAVVSLLLDAYQRRDKVALVTFAGSQAEIQLPPTSSVEIAKARIDEFAAGGRTPLAEGLLEAGEVIRREQIRDPRRRPLLVVVTDGRATFGPAALDRAHEIARNLARLHVPALVIDCETGKFRMGLGAELARHLGAEHISVGDVTAENLTTAIRQEVA